MPDAPSSAAPLPRSDGYGARIPSARLSGVPSPRLLAGVRPRSSPAGRRARQLRYGPSCCPPLRVVSPRNLYGRGDLLLVCEVIHIAEHEQRGLQLPRLEEVRLRQPRVEVSDGGEELG